jgi:hypothetical protein
MRPAVVRSVRAGSSAAACFVALIGAGPAAATETIGSSQAHDSTQAGPCGQPTCLVFQDTAPSGSVIAPTASGQVTDITIKKTAGTLNIQPVIISPASQVAQYTLESIGATIALNPAAGNQTYPLTAPLAIDPGDTVGIRYPDGPAPADPKLYNDDPTNGGSMTRIGNTSAGPGLASLTGRYPVSARFANYDMNFKFTVTTPTPTAQYDLVAEPANAVFTAEVPPSGLPLIAKLPDTTPLGDFTVKPKVKNDSGVASEATDATLVVSNWEDVAAPAPACFGPCSVPVIAAGGSHTTEGMNIVPTAPGRVSEWRAALPRTINLEIIVDCTAHETTCTNNAKTGTVTFNESPQSQLRRVIPDELTGNVTTPAGAEIDEVDVAVLDVPDGLKGFNGLAEADQAPQRAAAKKECRWLKNTKAKFSTSAPDGKTCDGPVWLEAKGTTKWSYKLRKDLPPGEYVAYARSTTDADATEFYFDGKDKNRKEFKVKAD